MNLYTHWGLEIIRDFPYFTNLNKNLEITPALSTTHRDLWLMFIHTKEK